MKQRHAETGYRRDIDGLRALAILPVVLSHLHFSRFAGGYVGVDIFFVISGYLITGIISREFDAGRFSFVHFYERRARRILPALLAMVAFVLVGASLLYLPGDFESVPKSALMTLAFMANFWFQLHTGYFDPDSATMPLLHCWSLAVEEQFYIAMPLLLWFIAWVAPRRRFVAFAVASLASFGFCLWTQQALGTSYYFLPFGRAWELLAGAFLTTGAIAQPRPGLLREALAVLGIGLIGWAIRYLDAATPFPGMATLLPVLGTALLLHCAPGTLVGRVLSSPLPVGFGLISYSLYLWHWPLIAFAEYWRDAPLAGLARYAVFAAALPIAWASWRFVERPFRNPARMPRRRIFAFSAIGLFSMGVAAAALTLPGGWESRFSPAVLGMLATKAEAMPKTGSCIADQLDDYPEGCHFGATTVPTTLVWGDSQSYMLTHVLADELKPQGRSITLHAMAGCLPTMGWVQSDPIANKKCQRFNARVFTYIQRTPSITRVYLVGNWQRALFYYRTPLAIAQFDATIASLRAAGKSVVVFGPIPNQPYDVPRHLAHLAFNGKLAQARGVSAANFQQQTAWFTANFPRWEAEGNTILDPARALVTGSETQIILGGKPLYVDNRHLSRAGAAAVLKVDPRR